MAICGDFPWPFKPILTWPLTVKWCYFTNNIAHYIKEAYDRQSEVHQYTLFKEVE